MLHKITLKSLILIAIFTSIGCGDTTAKKDLEKREVELSKEKEKANGANEQIIVLKNLLKQTFATENYIATRTTDKSTPQAAGELCSSIGYDLPTDAAAQEIESLDQVNFNFYKKVDLDNFIPIDDEDKITVCVKKK